MKRYYIQSILTGIGEYTKGQKRNFTYGPNGELVKFENLCEATCHITQFDHTRTNLVKWYKSETSAKRAITRLTKNDRPDPNWNTENTVICVEV